MSGNGYKLLGYVVWQGGKRYLRRRLPSGRKIALLAASSVSAALAAAVIARRIAS